MLNRKCSNATVKAAGEPITIDASRAVNVVPTFAPSIYGKSFSIVISPIPARGTAREVLTELLYTTVVISNPHPKLLSGVLNT